MDKYILSKERAVGLGTYLVSKGYIEKDIVIGNAKKGLVPSGFESRNEFPRISWMESPMLADALLVELAKPEEVEDVLEEETKGILSFMKKENK